MIVIVGVHPELAVWLDRIKQFRYCVELLKSSQYPIKCIV